MCPAFNPAPWFSVQIVSRFPSSLLLVPTLPPPAPPALGKASTWSQSERRVWKDLAGSDQSSQGTLSHGHRDLQVPNPKSWQTTPLPHFSFSATTALNQCYLGVLPSTLFRSSQLWLHLSHLGAMPGKQPKLVKSEADTGLVKTLPGAARGRWAYPSLSRLLHFCQPRDGTSAHRCALRLTRTDLPPCTRSVNRAECLASASAFCWCSFCTSRGPFIPLPSRQMPPGLLPHYSSWLTPSPHGAGHRLVSMGPLWPNQSTPWCHTHLFASTASCSKPQ